MSDIILVHRKSNQEFTSLAADTSSLALVWKTCLRQIVIFQNDNSDFKQNMGLSDLDEIHENEDALKLLIEILCGLHSPVFGETEVFGQFKKYIETLPAEHVFKSSPNLTQFIFKTVKEVRSQFLKQAGGMSYGHVLRKKLKDFDEISLWGYGQLGQEIAPWLSKKQLQVIVRNPFSNADFSVVSEKFRKKTRAHVIAAPLEDDHVLNLLGDDVTELVIDLRGHTQLVHPHHQVIPLVSVMQEIEKLKQEQKIVLPECEAAIADMVSKHFSSTWHRPFGWEDLCG